jgi:hypothetical protein
MHRETTAALTLIRWRAGCGWLGIMAGVGVFVAALAVPLDDPALVAAFAVVRRDAPLIA